MLEILLSMVFGNKLTKFLIFIQSSFLQLSQVCILSLIFTINKPPKPQNSGQIFNLKSTQGYV